MPNREDELIPTRASLIGRLKDWQDKKSWEEFFNTYWKLIYGVARKTGLSDAEAQDVVQDTILTVAKAMPEFQYDPTRGSFKGWLCKTTHWRIGDYLRRRARYPLSAGGNDDSAGTPLIERIADPASLDLDRAWEADWQKNLLEAAIDKVRAQVKPMQYQLFDCYVLKGWPMREVTQKLRVSMAQVYFAKMKMSSLVRKELHQLERKWI